MISSKDGARQLGFDRGPGRQVLKPTDHELSVQSLRISLSSVRSASWKQRWKGNARTYGQCLSLFSEGAPVRVPGLSCNAFPLLREDTSHGPLDFASKAEAHGQGGTDSCVGA